MFKSNRVAISLIVFIVIVCSILFFIIFKNSRKSFKELQFEGFDEKVLSKIANISNSKLSYLTETEIDNIDISKYKIIKFEIVKEKRPEVLLMLKEEFKGSEYNVFYSKVSYDKTPELICILKSADKYDALRALKSNGINYDIDTDSLIEKLKEWEKEYGIEIEGADGDWVDIKFNKLPEDIKKFAKEIYEFCPDSVDQGVGSLEELENYLKVYRGVFLWWD